MFIFDIEIRQNFKSKSSSENVNDDFIPGESERDRRLRLRALEKKARLGSAKSNASIYSNPSISAPAYQENIKFPDNSNTESNELKPIIPMEIVENKVIDQGFEFKNLKREDINYPSFHQKETDQIPSQVESEIGGFPGLSNQYDRFRQKQANMKKEMQKDFQSYMQQNQSIDPRKQKIEKQRQFDKDTNKWGRAQTYSEQSKYGDRENALNKRNQIADEVFNEIMQKKGNYEVDSKIGSSEYEKESQDNHSNFLFKSSEDEEKQRLRMKKQEYGDILRSQMSSAQHERSIKNQYSNIPTMIEKIGNNHEQQRVKIDKDEYRFALQKQIEEKKIQQQIEKEEYEREEAKFRKQIESIQGSGYDSNKAKLEFNKGNNAPPVFENPTYARQSTITSQNYKSQESIIKQQQYQYELKAQIEEKERQAKLEKQRLREQEDLEDRKKIEEHNQLVMEY